VTKSKRLSITKEPERPTKKAARRLEKKEGNSGGVRERKVVLKSTRERENGPLEAEVGASL